MQVTLCSNCFSNDFSYFHEQFCCNFDAQCECNICNGISFSSCRSKPTRQELDRGTCEWCHKYTKVYLVTFKGDALQQLNLLESPNCAGVDDSTDDDSNDDTSN